ncbi:unnamed protein product [Xylocopa violacea]|uniref:Uncharacterized protein n=1 Tax=Xylocopa violacea TaxID=135666 RepID=A0ABP1P6K7_XYLVO
MASDERPRKEDGSRLTGIDTRPIIFWPLQIARRDVKRNTQDGHLEVSRSLDAISKRNLDPAGFRIVSRGFLNSRPGTSGLPATDANELPPLPAWTLGDHRETGKSRYPTLNFYVSSSISESCPFLTTLSRF